MASRQIPCNMNKKPIPDSRGFAKTPEVLATFSATPHFFELSGPGTLVRLVQFKKTTCDGLRLGNSRHDGQFWFEEELLTRVRNQARSDLSRQRAGAKAPFTTPFGALVSNYMRHVLRDSLAVSKDWTNDFDGYVRVRLLTEDHLVALVGPVKRQPAFSKEHPQHQAVVANNIWLEGQATQFAIDFRFPANRLYVQRIHGPFEF